MDYYRKNCPRKKRKHFIKIALIIIAVIFILLILSATGIFAYFAKDLPDPAEISERKITQSTKIYDRTGKILLYDIHGEEKRTIIPFDEIPQYVKNATIVAEDDNFYRHNGFDIKGIIRALWVDIKNRQIRQGGSTITQQFIKQAILTSDRTFTRKIKEVILSLQTERKYSKDEILNFYLNQVPYGSNAYGIEAAAITFFNKTAKDLTLGESAILAALPKAPTYYSPYGNNKKDLKNRQLYILEKMFTQGYIAKEELEKAKNENMEFSQEFRNIRAPHFVMYIKSYLVEKYGEDAIETKGFKVITTLNWNLQEKAEKIIKERVEINRRSHKANNAALVAINPNTGEILSMVGSYDYFDSKNDGNVNVTIRPRQPGSSFKPFAYAQAFIRGLTPDTLIFDLKTEFNSNCPADGSQEKDQYGLECYHPQNYDSRHRGPVQIKSALAQSLNIPAVKVLYIAGVEDTIKLAKKMGITTLNDPNRYGLSLVLGGGEVTLLDETMAYGIFATEGKKYPIKPVIKIEDGNGKIIEEFNPENAEGEQVLDAEIARQITNILSSNDLRAPIFGEFNYLNLDGIPAGVKTGTTQEYRDAWTVGYTPDLTVGVWVGNNDNAAMIKADGSSVAAPIWNTFMKEALKDKEVKKFNAPQKIITGKNVLDGNLGGKIYKTDKISGKLATELTPPDLMEEKIYFEARSILYYIDTDNIRGDFPETPENNSQFANWELPIAEWSKEPRCIKEKISIEGTENFDETEKCFVFNQEPPTEYDDIHTVENKPKISILSPQNQQSYKKGEFSRIEADIQGNYKISQTDFFIDGSLIGGDSTKPFAVNLFISQNIAVGEHKIKVRAYDIHGNTDETETAINVID